MSVYYLIIWEINTVFPLPLFLQLFLPWFSSHQSLFFIICLYGKKNRKQTTFFRSKIERVKQNSFSNYYLARELYFCTLFVLHEMKICHLDENFCSFQKNVFTIININEILSETIFVVISFDYRIFKNTVYSAQYLQWLSWWL